MAEGWRQPQVFVGSRVFKNYMLATFDGCYARDLFLMFDYNIYFIERASSHQTALGPADGGWPQGQGFNL